MARRGRRIVFDIETAGGLKRHPAKRELLCLGLYDGRETLVVPEDQFSELWKPLYHALAQCYLIAHNGKFDTVTLSWYLLGVHAPLKVWFDTQLAHYVLYPASQNHALDIVVEKFYGWESWSLEQVQYRDMRSVPKAELYRYLAKDVQGTGALAADLAPMVKASENATFVMDNILMRGTNRLSKDEWYGVCIDTPYAKELLATVTGELNVALASVQDKADAIVEGLGASPAELWPRSHGPGSVRGKPVWVHTFNPGSPNQIKKLYALQGVELKTTDEKAMDKLAAKGDEFAPVLINFRKAQKTIGTYVQPNIDVPPLTLSKEILPGDRMFPSYKLFGTVTGRLSADGKNIQNQPREERIKRQFVSSGFGRVLMQADYSQAELRVMAALGNDAWLIELFADDENDIFEGMLPMAFPHRVPRNKEEKKEMRAALKGVIYGLAYGRQARAIALELGMRPPEAQAIIDNFLNAAQGLATWRQSVYSRLHAGTGIVTRFGRYFQNDVITNKNKDNVERSALSFEPQSSSSDCCFLAYMDLFDWIEQNDKNWQLMALVHDSITLDVPEKEAEEASHITRQFLVASAEKWFPEVHFKAEGAYAVSWEKT